MAKRSRRTPAGRNRLARTAKKKPGARKPKPGYKKSPAVHLFEKDSLKFFLDSLDELERGFEGLPASTARIKNKRDFAKVLGDVVERMKDNYPYFHPLYAGQMLKPPHPLARVAYMLSMWINPNNHALDGGRASSGMEKEAVAEIAGMFGWETHLGHLTGGGTMANLEALWVAGQLKPGKKVVASEQAHYTHSRISSVLGLNFATVPCDNRGRMNIDALRGMLDLGDVGTVVATIGTTAVGALDPLPRLIELRGMHSFRLHVDAAYGGYFTLAGNLSEEARALYARIGEADSIVIDPHKHGLQPYGCGCVVFRDPAVARFYKHDSPYTYFTSEELHLGEISLECSRAGASAVGLWATQKLLPLTRGGAFAESLEMCHEAALDLYDRLRGDARFVIPFSPELDIVVWAPRAASASGASRMSRMIFGEAAKMNLHLALAELPAGFFDLDSAGMIKDAETITCLRSVLMKPEHKEWIGKMWEILSEACDRVMGGNGSEKKNG